MKAPWPSIAEGQTPRSVYVHVPFCRHRCGYCNFTLVANRDHLIDDYLRCIQLELEMVPAAVSVDTIYLGGGTPSRLSANQLQRLISLLESRFSLVDGGEFTMEANPDDLPGEVAAVIQSSRINRISLGVQSFDEKKLRSLDRDHGRTQIDAAIEACRRSVDQFSIDLIFAAPGEVRATLNQDLAQAVQSGAGHISTYELTFEKGTQFWNAQTKGGLRPVENDDCAEFYELTIETLCNAGYEQYEISSFAKPRQRSRHNQIYWSAKPYFAFGPGASGLVGNVRYTNDRSVGRYLKKVLAGTSPVEQKQSLSNRDLAIERLVFGLRMIDGIEVARFEGSFGFPLFELVDSKEVEKLVELRFLEPDIEYQLKMTRAGVMVADYVCSQFFSS